MKSPGTWARSVAILALTSDRDYVADAASQVLGVVLWKASGQLGAWAVEALRDWGPGRLGSGYVPSSRVQERPGAPTMHLVQTIY